jgi:hypothetical protein
MPILYNIVIMAVVRYSATDIFGIPLDNPEAMTGLETLVELMEAYSIEPREVKNREPIDITPYFWQKPNFRYWLSSPKRGRAQVDLMPVRTIYIPEPARSTAIIGGGSPRFAGELCLYEAVVLQK